MVLHHSKGFFQRIGEEYGTYCTTLLKNWMNVNRSLVSATQQLIFLLKCRRRGVFLAHISNMRFNFNMYIRKNNTCLDKIKKRTFGSILSLEIRDLNCYREFLRLRIVSTEREISELLPHFIIDKFYDLNGEKLYRLRIHYKIMFTKKLNTIIDKNDTYKSFFNIDNSKWLVNVSKKELPERIHNLLSLGDRFGLPLSSRNKNDRLFSVLETIKNVEMNSYKIPLNLTNKIRGTVSNSLRTFLNCSKNNNYLEKLILKDFSQCTRFLRENRDVFVTKADKGQVTVVLDRDNYINNMEILLSDVSTYRMLKKDPIRSITHKLNTLIKAWRDQDIIDVCLYRRLNCTNGNLPRCYGLPKIHKVGFPLRIIVSTVGSPLYGIASLLNELIVKSVPKPKSYIKDSWSFVEYVSNFNIHLEEILLSFDVTALFTNIPKELVFKGIRDRWHHLSTNTKLNLEQFLHALELILTSTSFSFNGRVYEQIFGSPMGSPLSPILADIVMEDLETYCLGCLDFDVRMYVRYVDDIFMVAPREKVDSILNTFNSYHVRLKFTYELECNGSIPFLDTLVIRDDNKLVTDWYRKPTFSGRYVNFFSGHPYKYKINSIFNLVDRAVLLSDERFHMANLELVKNILINNAFPKKVIDRHMKNRVFQIKNGRNIRGDFIFNSNLYVTIPYIKDLSECVRQNLKKVGLDVLYTIPKKLDIIIKRGKDRLEKMDETNCVYRIKCKDCESSYIGQTKRHLHTRLKEHRTNIKKHDSDFSVVTRHRLDHHHDFDWDAPEILHKETYYKKREVAEMFFIKKYEHTINLKKDTDNLNILYDDLISIT